MIQCLKNKITTINKKIDDFLNTYHSKIDRFHKIDELKIKICKIKDIYLNEINRNKMEIDRLNDSINQMMNEIQNKNDIIQQQHSIENDLQNEKEKLIQIVEDITPQYFLYQQDDIIKFNNFKGETQKLYVSKIIEQNQNANPQLLQKIYDLLCYLSKEQLKNSYLNNSKNYIYIHPKNSKDDFCSLNEMESIGISSYMTDTLYKNGSLSSPELIDLMNKFDKIYIEIGYEQEKFEKIHEIVTDICISKYNNLKIGVNIFEFRNYEYFQNDSKKLYSVRINSKVGDKISSGGQSKGRFENCALLEILTIDDGINYIEGGSFCFCKNLKYIQFGSSVKYIGNSSFNGCEKLTNLSFPQSLELIDHIAFNNCNELISIEINPYKAKIRPDSFNNCLSLKKFTIYSSFNSTMKCEFENYEIFSHVIIPDSIKAIGTESFKSKMFLKKISIPSSVEIIEDEAFYRCTQLEEIKFSTTLKSIGKKAFYGCALLKELNIPSSVKIIDEYAFSECICLEHVLFSDHSQIKEISPHLFENCSSLIQISIPTSVISIKSNSFKGCTSLKKVIIPNSVKEFGISTFEKCTSLFQITFPSSLNEIGRSCFEGCTSLKKIMIEEQQSEILINQKKIITPLKVCKFLKADLDMEAPGILCELRNKSKTRFDRHFIASQSSNDIYRLIDPHSNDEFGTNNNGHFFIEIELKEEVNINGVKIFSSDEYFPKSFDIEIDGTIRKSITSASELNGKFKEMTINIDPIICHRFRFIQTGPNWDKGNDFLYIKRIELLSPESKYSAGVFSTLVSSNPNKDPHKCPIIISSLLFDFNTFHLLNTSASLCTFSNSNSWFQIEFLNGIAIINGFRLKRVEPNLLKRYKIICTDDVNKSIEEWTVLIEINESKKDMHNILDIYELAYPSPPVRFFRIIQTGLNWNDKLFFQLFHFDLFGILIYI